MVVVESTILVILAEELELGKIGCSDVGYCSAGKKFEWKRDIWWILLKFWLLESNIISID